MSRSSCGYSILSQSCYSVIGDKPLLWNVESLRF